MSFTVTVSYSFFFFLMPFRSYFHFHYKNKKCTGNVIYQIVQIVQRYFTQKFCHFIIMQVDIPYWNHFFSSHYNIYTKNNDKQRLGSPIRNVQLRRWLRMYGTEEGLWARSFEIKKLAHQSRKMGSAFFEYQISLLNVMIFFSLYILHKKKKKMLAHIYFFCGQKRND